MQSKQIASFLSTQVPSICGGADIFGPTNWPWSHRNVLLFAPFDTYPLTSSFLCLKDLVGFKPMAASQDEKGRRRGYHLDYEVGKIKSATVRTMWCSSVMFWFDSFLNFPHSSQWFFE